MKRRLIIFAALALIASSTQAEDLKKLNLDERIRHRHDHPN